MACPQPAAEASITVGCTFDSLATFQAASTAFMKKFGSQDIVSFSYEDIEAVVCFGWQEHDCSAGVAAETLDSPSPLWVVRAIEIKHDSGCFDYVRKIQGAHNPRDKGCLAVAPTVEDVSNLSIPAEPKHSSFETGRNPDAASDALAINSRSRASSNAHRSSSGHAILTIGSRFASLQQFQAAASAFAETRYPEYPVYFRARNNDRPEYYCKYQNATTAQTAPGLNCKYGFNAKWRAEESCYVVTKSVHEHTPECQKRTELAGSPRTAVSDHTGHLQRQVCDNSQIHTSDEDSRRKGSNEDYSMINE